MDNRYETQFEQLSQSFNEIKSSSTSISEMSAEQLVNYFVRLNELHTGIQQMLEEAYGSLDMNDFKVLQDKSDELDEQIRVIMVEIDQKNRANAERYSQLQSELESQRSDKQRNAEAIDEVREKMEQIVSGPNNPFESQLQQLQELDRGLDERIMETEAEMSKSTPVDLQAAIEKPQEQVIENPETVFEAAQDPLQTVTSIDPSALNVEPTFDIGSGGTDSYEGPEVVINPDMTVNMPGAASDTGVTGEAGESGESGATGDETETESMDGPAVDPVTGAATGEAGDAGESGATGDETETESMDGPAVDPITGAATGEAGESGESGATGDETETESMGGPTLDPLTGAATGEAGESGESGATGDETETESMDGPAVTEPGLGAMGGGTDDPFGDDPFGDEPIEPGPGTSGGSSDPTSMAETEVARVPLVDEVLNTSTSLDSIRSRYPNPPQNSLAALMLSGTLPSLLPEAALLRISRALNIPTPNGLNTVISPEHVNRLLNDKEVQRARVNSDIVERHTNKISEYDNIIANYNNAIERLRANNVPNAEGVGRYDATIAKIETLRDNVRRDRNNYVLRVNNIHAASFRDNFGLKRTPLLSERRYNRLNKKLRKKYKSLDKHTARRDKYKTKFMKNIESRRINRILSRIQKLQEKEGAIQEKQTKIFNDRSEKYITKVEKRQAKYIKQQQKIAAQVEKMEQYNAIKDERQAVHRDVTSDIESINMNPDRNLRDKIARVGLKVQDRRLQSQINRLQRKAGRCDRRIQHMKTVQRRYM